jgi:uncharacterized RDD family membrane protein YckC
MLKIPGGEQAAQPQTKSRRQVGKAVPAAPPPSDSDFLAGLDFSHAEDAENRVCPFCAEDIDPEVKICPSCGVNLTTGRMDVREAKRRSRKGPEASKFYREAWTDSWSFVKEHRSLALRTGWYITLFTVLNWACAFMVNYCTNLPPKTFWFACFILTALGVPGWYFFLSTRIIDYSMSSQAKLDRIHFDFFQCVTLGMRAIFWPAIMLLPFVPVLLVLFLGGAVSGNPMVMGAAALGFGLFPAVAFPLAMVHMTAKYTYKAWVLWELLKVFTKNVGPALYWVMMAVLLLLPFAGIFAGIELAGGGMNLFFNERYLGLTEQGFQAVWGIVGMQPSGMIYNVARAAVTFLLTFLVLLPLLLAMGFPIVMLMRANGLLGYYRQPDLDLVPKMSTNTPCGFWVRMLAFLVDLLLFPLASFIVTKEPKAVMIAQALNGIGLLGGLTLGKWFLMYAIGPCWIVYNWWMYFAIQESSSQKTTIGKDGFGLIVLTNDNRQMTLGHSSRRFFCSLATLLTGFAGFLMCAFHPEKRALHDLLSNTKVVWKGDK